MKAVCIDMGGTNIKAGIVEDGKTKHFTSIPAYSSDDFAHTISRIDQLINDLLGVSGIEPGHIEGIGIAVSGIVDVKRNKVLDINEKYTDARDFDFDHWSEESHHTRLYMENDARAALIGEWQFGRGRSFNDIVMVTLGTGVGGAAMINGKLLYGKNYQAGCLGGHFTVNYNGSKCTCGNTGCVEAEASSWALGKLIEKHKSTSGDHLSRALNNTQDKIDFRELFRLSEEGEEVAAEIINHCLKVWSAGIVSMIHAYDPEIVLISGGIMKSSEVILPFIREWVAENAWMPTSKVEIEVSGNLADAALLGMYYMVNQESISMS